MLHSRAIMAVTCGDARLAIRWMDDSVDGSSVDGQYDRHHRLPLLTVTAAVDGWGLSWWPRLCFRQESPR